MIKRYLLLLLLALPLLVVSQPKKNQRLAEMTYNSLKSAIGTPSSEEREGMIKSLKAVVDMAEDKEFIQKVEAEIKQLESLIDFRMPRADITKLNDSLVHSKNMVYEKVGNMHYIEPNADFRQVMMDNTSGLYLFLMINELNQISLELTHYTQGEKELQMTKAVLSFGEKEFDYPLVDVRTRKSGMEFCALKTNSNSFISLYEALSAYQGSATIEYKGENGDRTAPLSEGILMQIKDAYALYKALSAEE